MQITNATFSPLDYVTLVDVPTGNGLVFMQTLTFAAGNLNTLEGCYHAYTPYSTPYPGERRRHARAGPVGVPCSSLAHTPLAAA